MKAELSALRNNTKQLEDAANRWETVANTLQNKYKTVDLGEYQRVKTELAEAQKQLLSAEVRLCELIRCMGKRTEKGSRQQGPLPCARAGQLG